MNNSSNQKQLLYHQQASHEQNALTVTGIVNQVCLLLFFLISLLIFSVLKMREGRRDFPKSVKALFMKLYQHQNSSYQVD